MKILSSVAFATLMVVGSAWALDSNTTLDTSGSASVRWDTWENRRDLRENVHEVRQDLRELNGQIRDYRQDYRKDMVDARADCNAMLAADTENRRDEINAECNAEFAVYRDALRDNVTALYREKYTRLLADLRVKMNAFSNYFQDLSDSERAEFMARVDARLDVFEDSAHTNKRDINVLLAAGIRQILNDWEDDMQ